MWRSRRCGGRRCGSRRCGSRRCSRKPSGRQSWSSLPSFPLGTLGEHFGCFLVLCLVPGMKNSNREDNSFFLNNKLTRTANSDWCM